MIFELFAEYDEVVKEKKTETLIIPGQKQENE